MSLTPKRKKISDGIPVFSKIIEIFTGGFTLQTSGFNADITLPAGSLLTVDEAARTAAPVKTAISAGTAVLSSATAHLVKTPHHFQVGDTIARRVGRGAFHVKSIIPSGANDILVVGTSIGVGMATGNVFFQSSGYGTDKAALADAPNALSFADIVIESGASVAAVRRATAYKNRIQAHNDGHLTSLPATIQLSKSY